MNRAEERKRIFKQTFICAFALLLIVFMYLTEKLCSSFPVLPQAPLGGAVAGLSIVLALRFAYHRCQHAGLIDQPVKTIEVVRRTADSVVPRSFGVWNRGPLLILLLLGFVSFVMFALIGWLELLKSGFNPAHDTADAFNTIFSSVMTVFGVLLLIFPAAKLDSKGVSGYHRGYFWRRVRWSDIGLCEIVSMVGENGRVLSQWAVFKDAQGRVILSFDNSWASLARPSDQQKFWALLRRNLTGMEAKLTESNKISQA